MPTVIRADSITQPLDTGVHAIADAHLAWLSQAACVGVATSVFYPRYANGDLTEALLICRSCPVRLACLEHAIVTREVYGVWGGTTPEARRRLIGVSDAIEGCWDVGGETL